MARTPMDGFDVNRRIQVLVEAWCARREYGALASVLPPWLANNGLTDGWGELGKALRWTSHGGLPEAELLECKLLWIIIDNAIRDV